MDSATESIHLGDPGVDRHHRIIRNTHFFFPSSWSHAPLPSFHGSTQFVWFIMAGYPFISSHPLPTLLELEPLFPTNSPFGYHARCGGVLMMGCLPSSSTVSPHHDRVNLEMHSEAVIELVWTYTWRLRSSEFGDAPGGRDREIHLEDVIERVWTCTLRP